MTSPRCVYCGRFIAGTDLCVAMPYGSYEDEEEPDVIFAHAACLTPQRLATPMYWPWGPLPGRPPDDPPATGPEHGYHVSEPGTVTIGGEQHRLVGKFTLTLRNRGLSMNDGRGYGYGIGFSSGGGCGSGSGDGYGDGYGEGYGFGGGGCGYGYSYGYGTGCGSG